MKFVVSHPRPAGIYSFLIGEANNNRFLPCGRNDIVICSTYIMTDSRTDAQRHDEERSHPDICSFLLDEKRTKESRAGPSDQHTWRALPRRPAHSLRTLPGQVLSFLLSLLSPFLLFLFPSIGVLSKVLLCILSIEAKHRRCDIR